MRPQLRLALVPLISLAVITSGCADLLDAADRGPGSKFDEYLSSGGTLLLELDVAPGNKPSNQVIDAFKKQLSRITSKTIQVTVTAELPDAGDGKTYTVDELEALHAEHQDHSDSGDTVVMHGLLVDGKIQNDRTAGLAFNADAWAIAMGTMRENTSSSCGGLIGSTQPSMANALRAVTIHEAGHLLGLVNIGLEMVQDHEDDDHPGHSTNDDSVMWWEVEVGPRLSNIFSCGEDIPFTFDRNDMQDAQAFRESSS